MPLKQVIIKSPATSANLGPGFDVFGLALEQPCDKVTIQTIPDELKIQVTGLSAQTISTIPEKNTAGVVANQIKKEFSIKTGLNLIIEKGIKTGAGLGSSAASAAAVAYGLNLLFNLGLSNNELIRFAAKGEIASAGFEHADNVSAAICGNFVIIKSYNPLSVISLECPKNMEVCIALPNIVILGGKTRKARSIVAKWVPIKKHIYNVGRAAAMATGFAKSDVDLIGESMSDAIVEPTRAAFIPGYHQVKEKAYKAGACGVAVSGAGPAMIAIANNEIVDSTKVAHAMQEGFRLAGIDSVAFITKPGKGACLLETKP
jgi:homoserine kinase